MLLFPYKWGKPVDKENSVCYDAYKRLDGFLLRCWRRRAPGTKKRKGNLCKGSDTKSKVWEKLKMPQIFGQNVENFGKKVGWRQLAEGLEWTALSHKAAPLAG